MERHGHLVFLDDDMGYGRCCGHGILQDAVRHLRLLNHKMFLLPAFHALERFLVDVDDLDLGRDELHFCADFSLCPWRTGDCRSVCRSVHLPGEYTFFLHGKIFPAARPNPASASASCAVCGPGLRSQVPVPMVWLPLRPH